MPKRLLVAAALASLAACATQTVPLSTVPVAPSPSLAEASPATQFTSNADFQTTSARLKAAIEARGLTLFTIVDHAAGAQKVGQTLAPNTLYIFGNPKAGTPLMQANPVLGLHLPLKAQVRAENGTVLVSVSDIRQITASAGVAEPRAVIAKITQTLNAIGTEAAGG